MAASVPTAPTAPIAPPSTGGTITRDATGEIFNLQQPTGELATFEDRLKETIASGGTTQAMRAQSAREASPSASPTQVAAAQREQVQREAEGAADRAAAEYSRGLSLDGQSIGAINEKVAEFRAAYMLGQEGEGGKASTSTRGGRTHAQGIAEERLALDKAKFVDEVVAREGAPADLTAAQKKFAEKSGESAHEWDQGGRSRAKENIEKFNTVLTDLEDGNLDTRTLVEFAPFVGDWARSAVNPTGQQGLDTIRGVIFQGLRDTLGAQFTEREGERLVNAAYNTKLDEASNIARLKPALARMRDTFAAKEALTQHILAGGSVRDYKGKTPWEVYNGAGGSSGGSPIEGDVDIAEFDNALL
jgi:hypothetical protein